MTLVLQALRECVDALERVEPQVQGAIPVADVASALTRARAALEHKDPGIPILDLHGTLAALTETTVEGRIQEFLRVVPAGVYVTALGGFPIIDGHWCGQPFTMDLARTVFRQAAGLPYLLTNLNRRGTALTDLGRKGSCKVTLTLLFVGAGSKVEEAISRNVRFQVSWPEPPSSSGTVFAVTATFQDWMESGGVSGRARLLVLDLWAAFAKPEAPST